jgi:hypothetical protein
MVCFQTKNLNLGKFGRVLQYNMFVFFMDTWSILLSFVTFYGHLVQFVVIWYIFPNFGILYQEKSGNPGCDCSSNILRRAAAFGAGQKKCWKNCDCDVP